MTGRNRVAAIAGIGGFAVAVVAAGCTLPRAPGPLPTDWVPSPEPSGSMAAPLLSPDGFDAAQRMTVRVRNVGCSSLETGTGFAIDEHTLVTAAHVIEGAHDLEISTYDGHTYDATASATTTVADLAIVRIEEVLPASATLAVSDPSPADAVTIVGYPDGGRLTTQGAVVVTTDLDDVDPDLGPAFTATIAVEPGMSGAPVINADGEVVGVVYGVSDRLPQTFFVPVSTLRALLDQPPALVPEDATC